MGRLYRIVFLGCTASVLVGIAQAHPIANKLVPARHSDGG